MSKVTSFLGRFREATVLLIFVVFCIIMAIASPFFFTWNNISVTIIGACAIILLVIGETMVMAAGGIDLSVGANMALSGTVCGYLFVTMGVENIWVAAIIGILCAGGIGLANGIVLSRTNIAPMITTLATMNIANGIAMILTTGSPISMKNVPATFSAIGKGSIGFMPVLIIIAIIAVVVFHFLLVKSTIFRKSYYIGSNAQSAEYSGIDVARVKVFIYVLTGLLAGLGGIMTASRFSVASANAGSGAEMTVISACVIGGSSMSGGTGTVIGSLLGIMLLTFINNALILLNVNVYWQNMISGCILLLAVLIDFFSRRHRIANN